MSSSTPIDAGAELRALLCCARVEIDERARDELAALLRAGLDLRALAHAAARHGLTPLLLRHLQALAPDACPPELLAELRAATQRSVASSLAQAAELVALHAALTAAGIPALAIKGPICAALCYGELGLRVFSDLDLLIAPEHVPLASELLRARGYAPAWPLSAAWQARLIGTGSELLFRHADGSRLVDLHWALMPRGYSFTPGDDGVFARRQDVAIGAAQIPTLGNEATLLFLLLHGMKHDWESLGWLCDVAELLRRSPALDWDELSSWSAAPGRRRFIDIGLSLAHELLSAPVPSAALQRAASDPAVAAAVAAVQRRLRAPAAAEDRSLLERSVGMLYFRAMERTRDRAQFVHDVVFRPTPLEWLALPLPAALAPLHYLVRPLRLLWKHGWPAHARAERG